MMTSKFAFLLLIKILLTYGFIWVTAQAQTELVNIALGKNASQTGAYGGATADRAVDGKYDEENTPNYLSVCAFSDSTFSDSATARWSLDLGDTYSVAEVVVYNTYRDTDFVGYTLLNNFRVDLLSEDGKVNTSCGVYMRSDPVRLGGNYTFSCHGRRGRFVNVTKLDSFENQYLLILCEVEVYAISSSSPNATSTAVRSITTTAERRAPVTTGETTAPRTARIETTTAILMPEASPPQTTTDVVNGCPGGDDCQVTCGHCAPLDGGRYDPCHRSGRCINGCVLWWTGQSCETEIVLPKHENEVFKALLIESDTILLEIEQVKVDGSLSTYYGYEVSYGEQTLEVNHNGNQTNIIITLRGLGSNSQYNVTVRPFRVMKGRRDFGMSYPWKVFKTKCVAPGHPIISSIVEDDSVTVKYEASTFIGCSSLTSVALYYRTAGENGWKLVNSSSAENEAILDINKTTAHVFRVVATNNEGFQAENISPEIKVSVQATPAMVGLFDGSRATLIGWASFGGSVLLNVLMVTIIVNAYCGTSARRRRRHQRQLTSGPETVYSTDVIQKQSDRSADEESIYATHIGHVTDGGGETTNKSTTELDSAGLNSEFVVGNHTGRSIREVSELGFDTEPQSRSEKKTKKIKQAKVKKVKQTRKPIAPHYKNSDSEMNLYHVVD